MPLLVNDPVLENQLKAQRELTGADRFDEVWEGIYVMAPLANNEHMVLQAKLCGILQNIVGWSSAAQVSPGANISNRIDDWKRDYRCPDVAVFMPDTTARDCETHWVGGPDLAVEIVSESDRTREKIPFYESVGMRELLIIDRDPWRLELLRLTGGKLTSVGRCTVDAPVILESQVVPVSFTLQPSSPRALVRLTQTTTGQTWVI